VPIDVMGDLARQLTEFCESQRSTDS